MSRWEKAKVFGEMMEKRMMNMFKGKKSPLDEVDFETKKYLYEVKSCKLFTKGNNRNSRRKYVNKPHIDIESYKLGRFQIISENHTRLYLQSKKVKKIPKYVFCLRFGKQCLFRVLNWEDVDSLIVPNNKEYYYILLKDVFGEDIPEKPVKPRPRQNAISMMIERIRHLDKGKGVDVDKLIKEENDKKLLDLMKMYGEVFEFRPGRIKVI